jgi:hypothetical protein
MKYYKAIETATGSLLQWQLVARSIEELEAKNLENDPLVRSLNDIPALQFGVFPIKIEGGELVNRTAPEMAAIESAFEIRIALDAQRTKIDNLETSAFFYDGESFPMDGASRLFYAALERANTNQKLMTTSNEVYNLTSGNIAAFMTAYYNELLLLTKHDI